MTVLGSKPPLTSAESNRDSASVTLLESALFKELNTFAAAHWQFRPILWTNSQDLRGHPQPYALSRCLRGKLHVTCADDEDIVRCNADCPAASSDLRSDVPLRYERKPEGRHAHCRPA